MYGLSQENMLHNNFTLVYNEYKPSTEWLIEVASHYVDLNNWVEKNKKRLGRLNLKDFSPRFIFDHFYKLDCVLDLGSSKLGLQVTTDDTSLDSKLQTLNTLKNKGLYKAVGIDQVLLVLVTSRNENRLWSSKEIEDSIFDAVDFAYSNQEIKIFKLEVPD